MSVFKIAAALLITAGIVGLVYGGTDQKKTRDARIGPPERSISDEISTRSRTVRGHTEQSPARESAIMNDGWSGMMGGTGLYWLVAGLIVVVAVLAWVLQSARGTARTTSLLWSRCRSRDQPRSASLTRLKSMKPRSSARMSSTLTRRPTSRPAGSPRPPSLRRVA